MAGILALLAKGKPDASDKMTKGPDASLSDGPERTYAREAFSAAQDGDEEGFIDAFIGAVRACVRKEQSSSSEMMGDEDDGY